MSQGPQSGGSKPPGGGPKPSAPGQAGPVPRVPVLKPVGAVLPPLAPVVAPLVPVVPPLAPVKAAPAVKPAPGRGPSPEELAELELRCARLDELDYFEVLQLDREATPAAIKAAFYRESRVYHPDRFFHLTDPAVKERVNELYKRVTEAYYVLRADAKRRKYLADISGPERARKLRFTEVDEAETKQAAKREQEEQIGTHPKGREFYQKAMQDMEAERWGPAERNLKMALTYESQNQRYKDKLAEAQQKVYEELKKSGGSFKIK